MEEQFKQWLLQRGKTGAATNYPSAIRRISEHYSQQTGTPIDIYHIENQHLISEITHDYSQAGRFSAFGYDQHGRFRAAILRYSEFFVHNIDATDAELEPKIPSQTNFKNSTAVELLQLQASITDELKRRKVVRTKNNPLGDYTEWLVGKALGLELQNNSKAGYDGINKNRVRIQIKGRRVSSDNKSRQLSAIRKYNEKDFDELAAVIYDENFDVIDAVLIPHEVVGEYASFRKHVNAHILILKGPILRDPRVKCIKQAVCTIQGRRLG